MGTGLVFIETFVDIGSQYSNVHSVPRHPSEKYVLFKQGGFFQSIIWEVNPVFRVYKPGSKVDPVVKVYNAK